MSKILVKFLGLSFAIGSLAVTVITTAQPVKTMIEPVYSAGIWIGPICTCPIGGAGTCACKVD